MGPTITGILLDILSNMIVSPTELARRLLSYWRDSPLLKTATGNLILKITAAGLGLINGVLLARILGPSEFGIYSIAMAAMTLFATLSALGLPYLVTREVAVHLSREQWPLLKGLLLASQRWVIVASLFLILVVALFVLMGDYQSTLTMIGWISALLLIPLFALTQLRAAALRGLHWIVSADMPEHLFRPLLIIFILGGIYTFAIRINGSIVLVIQAGTALLSLCFISWLLSVRMPKEVHQVHAETTHLHWLRSSGMFLTITSLGLLEGQVPLYSLGHIAGAEQAGLFQAANQIVGLVVMGLAAVNMPLQPKLASAWASGDKTEVQRLVTETTRITNIIALPGVILILIFSENVLQIYSNHYVAAAQALRILAIGQIVNAMAGSCGILLLMTGHQKVVMLGSMLALLLNISIAYLFIPRYGVSGGALAAALETIFWNVFYSTYALKKLGINTSIFNFRVNQ